jgi:DNA-directed RNA polymerase specialized sigma24 family protein
MARSPDAPIIARSRHKPQVFGEIFERYFVVIHGYLQRRVGPGRADDLGAEVFRIDFQQRGRFETLRETALPWLYGIASNLVHQDERSEIRHLRALARLEGEELTYEQVAEALEIPVGTVRSRLNRARAQVQEALVVPHANGGRRRGRLELVGADQDALLAQSRVNAKYSL